MILKLFHNNIEFKRSTILSVSIEVLKMWSTFLIESLETRVKYKIISYFQNILIAFSCVYVLSVSLGIITVASTLKHHSLYTLSPGLDFLTELVGFHSTCFTEINKSCLVPLTYLIRAPRGLLVTAFDSSRGSNVANRSVECSLLKRK